MRVLFWSGNFWPAIGGAEILAAKLLPALRERGYEFIVVTLQKSPEQATEDRFKGIPVYRFPFSGHGNSMDQVAAGVMRTKQQVSQLKRAFAPDLIHVSAVDIGAFFHLITADAYRSPLLVTLHNFLSTQAVGDAVWLRTLLRGADWITCVSAAVLEETRRLLPEIAARSSVLYNGLNMPAALPQPLSVEPPRLLCLGRLKQRKGFHLALEAFASVVERFPDCRLIVAGDGPARPELEKLAAELKLSETMEFIGWVDPAKVPALISSASFVIMPSQFEGLPLVALEAALMARPVVGMNAPGLSEVVVHRETGLLVEQGDHRALADAMLFLLQSPATSARMGLEARRRVREVFGWERCVDAYDNLYRKLITQPRTDAGSLPLN